MLNYQSLSLVAGCTKNTATLLVENLDLQSLIWSPPWISLGSIYSEISGGPKSPKAKSPPVERFPLSVQAGHIRCKHDTNDEICNKVNTLPTLNSICISHSAKEQNIAYLFATADMQNHWAIKIKNALRVLACVQNKAKVILLLNGLNEMLSTDTENVFPNIEKPSTWTWATLL